MPKSQKPASNASQDLMAQLLKTQTVAKLKRGADIDATVIAVSKRDIVFDVGSKAHAHLGEKETKEITSYTPHIKVGATVRVRVISEESKDGYPVVSMRAFFEKGKWDILADKKNTEEEIEVVCGEYGKGGVFIDFMGIRGVIPKIQLTEDYLVSPEKLVGHKIKVKVLEVDEVKNRLVVSQKASALNISQKDLRKKFEKIKPGDKKKAKVLGVSEFGIFCEVDGVEGLIHISEISWEKVGDVSVLVKPNDVIDVVVVEKNTEDLKLNLSIKRLTEDPWKDIEARYPKDKEVTGEVVRKEKYGYFVRLEAGVEGLIHVSKLTGKEDFKIGQKIKTYIERVNVASRRLSLLLPQTEKPVMYR